MSTTERTGVEATIRRCRPADIQPIVIDGDDLESTAPGHLSDLKSALTERGYQPATITVEACFAADCTLATQEEADRLRGFVRAAAFLGAGRVELRIDEIADPERTEPALAALAERASREGVDLVRTGDPSRAG
ncbi:hypothetical protein [Halorubrum vacuolatum]|uniref:DUF7961 domain-containing protein n=1 Tax=Halorubrum vacuolatum TaxID=63740 RepID=A0A238VB28_HALVU|nr:hypothetical protein [Halorubrum vacuolatum]SNR31632.1 hypothetical protein SAMN06264855_102206 [Halorubrum vacuolatum]